MTKPTSIKKELFFMISITSIAKSRQRVIRYSEKHGVTAAGIRQRISRQAIYEWKAKYDGNWKSLIDRSHHRPHSHPKQQLLAISMINIIFLLTYPTIFKIIYLFFTFG